MSDTSSATAPISSAPVVVVGGGATGLCAAAHLRGALVLERMSRPAAKILVTGGGRCNLTHEGSPQDIARAFGEWERFVRPSFCAFPPAAQRAWFESLGVPCVVEPGGFVFPASQRAADVREALLRAAARAGTRIVANACVASIVLADDGASVAGVELADGRRIAAPRVVIAAGGSARPGLGTDGSGTALAADAGLAVAKPLPALGALLIAEALWMRDLAGVSLPDAVLTVTSGASGASRRAPSSRGGLLFTGDGLSGPAALNISGTVAAALDAGAAGGALRASWRADRTDPEAWRALFADWRASRGAALVRTLLAAELPRSLAAALCGAAGVPADCTAARLPQGAARSLAEWCATAPLRVARTEGFDACMATRGGVAVSELDRTTLECRRIRGLYVVGEAAEPVGPCGGYNLAWAWASGYAVAFAIASR